MELPWEILKSDINFKGIWLHRCFIDSVKQINIIELRMFDELIILVDYLQNVQRTGVSVN